MRPVAAIVSDLLGADLTARQLGLVLELVAAELSACHADSHADKADRRRELDRLRKQKSRAKSQHLTTGTEANDAVLSRGQSRGHADTSCDLTSLSSLESPRGNREVSKKDTASVNGRAEKVQRGTRLLAGSPLSESDLEFAIAEGMTRERAEKAWAEFVDYWIGVPGARGRKLDWPATWRNRVRDLLGKTGGRNGHRGSREFQDDSRSLSKAADRLIAAADRGEFKFAPRPGLPAAPREDDVLMLPPGRSPRS